MPGKLSRHRADRCVRAWTCDDVFAASTTTTTTLDAMVSAATPLAGISSMIFALYNILHTWCVFSMPFHARLTHVAMVICRFSTIFSWLQSLDRVRPDRALLAPAMHYHISINVDLTAR